MIDLAEVLERTRARETMAFLAYRHLGPSADPDDLVAEGVADLVRRTTACSVRALSRREATFGTPASGRTIAANATERTSMRFGDGIRVVAGRDGLPKQGRTTQPQLREFADPLWLFDSLIDSGRRFSLSPSDAGAFEGAARAFAGSVTANGAQHAERAPRKLRTALLLRLRRMSIPAILWTSEATVLAGFAHPTSVRRGSIVWRTVQLFDHAADRERHVRQVGTYRTNR